MEEEIAAKNNTKREIANTTDDSVSTDNPASADQLDSERPEMPEDMSGGPMGGGFPGQMSTGVITDTNEWLVPMTATGIISGVIVIATVAICLTMVFLNRKKN